MLSVIQGDLLLRHRHPGPHQLVSREGRYRGMSDAAWLLQKAADALRTCAGIGHALRSGRRVCFSGSTTQAPWPRQDLSRWWTEQSAVRLTWSTTCRAQQQGSSGPSVPAPLPNCARAAALNMSGARQATQLPRGSLYPHEAVARHVVARGEAQDLQGLGRLVQRQVFGVRHRHVPASVLHGMCQVRRDKCCGRGMTAGYREPSCHSCHTGLQARA